MDLSNQRYDFSHLEPTVRSLTDQKSSQFIKRKKLDHSVGDSETSISENLEKVTLTSTGDKTEEELVYETVTVSPQSNEIVTPNNFHYQPSGNAFRFNFSLPTSE